MRKKLYLLLCGVTLMITACSFNDSQNVSDQENKQQLAVQEKESYTARRYELPYTKNSSELDRIQEMSIGISTTEEGALEWYTVRTAVKKKYREKYKKCVAENQSIDPQWYSYYIMCYSLDDFGKWEQQMYEYQGDAKKMRNQFAKGKVFRGEDEKTYLFLLFCDDQEDSRKYGIELFNLENNQWKQCFETSYIQDGTENLYPINCYVDANSKIFLPLLNSKIKIFNLKTGEEDSNDYEFQTQTPTSVFYDGKLALYNPTSSEIIILTLDDFQEAGKITNTDSKAVLYSYVAYADSEIWLATNNGIYKAGLTDEEFVQISDYSELETVSMDRSIIYDFTVGENGMIYLHYMQEDGSEGLVVVKKNEDL